MKETRKWDWRDRSDRIFVRNQDALHIIMPYLVPGRTSNEVVMSEVIDIEKIRAYVDRKNAENPTFKYTWFQVIAAAFAKVIYLRPKLNCFIAGRRLYQRRTIQTAFMVKRKFNDRSEESCAKWILNTQEGSPLEQLHSYMDKFINKVRYKNEIDHSSHSMNFFKYIPSFLLSFIFWVLRQMERMGIYPKTFQLDDPCYCTIFLTNLGSIKAHADYHHTFNWGTNSFFVIISEMKKRLIINDDNSTCIKDTIKISITVDERIADGFYLAKCVRMLMYILQNPEILERDIKEPLDVEF